MDAQRNWQGRTEYISLSVVELALGGCATNVATLSSYLRFAKISYLVSTRQLFPYKLIVFLPPKCDIKQITWSTFYGAYVVECVVDIVSVTGSSVS